MYYITIISIYQPIAADVNITVIKTLSMTEQGLNLELLNPVLSLVYFLEQIRIVVFGVALS